MCTYAFSLRPSPLVQSYGYCFFKEDLTDAFCELLSTKEAQTTLQNKDTTIKSYQKMLNQNAKKSSGSYNQFDNILRRLRYFTKYSAENS